MSSYSSTFGWAFASLMAVNLASAQTATDLGKTLTPLGAEMKGNADNSIPAWKGGDPAVGRDAKDGAFFPDPYGAEKPLLTIDATNMERYKDKLSAGHMAMLKKYPTFKMLVYPTHRSAFYPKSYYDDSIANATRVTSNADGDVIGASAGVPFPLPKNGVEAIVNHKLRYGGNAFSQVMSRAIVSASGEVSYSRVEYESLYQYNNTDLKPAERKANISSFYLEKKLAPARVAGELALAHSYVNRQSNDYQTIWIYSPGQRRVRLAPELSYDSPQDDGLRTSDELDQFNGGTDRYTWKLLGKREMYVPYNMYKTADNSIKNADLLTPGHLNPRMVRYELHRIWTVEATLKPGASHIYTKRVFYLDEDTWQVLVQEKYDARGQLWRVSEAYMTATPELAAYTSNTDAYFDLQSGRYLVNNLVNEEKARLHLIKRTPDNYTPQNLRTLGTR